MKLSIIILLFLIGCSSPSGPPQLTPITTSGANSISWKLNGQVFIPSSYGVWPELPPFGVSIYRYSKDTTYWCADITTNSSKVTDIFHIILNKFRDTGTFLLGSASNVPLAIAFYTPDDDPDHAYNTSDGMPASIHISRFDTAAKVFSGTFEMDLIGGPTHDSVAHITDGRFDFTYKPM